MYVIILHTICMCKYIYIGLDWVVYFNTNIVKQLPSLMCKPNK